MPIACTLSDTKEFVLKADRDLPADQQTIFTLGPLSGRMRKRLLTLMDRDPGAGIYDAVRHGVHGWSNLKNAAGEEVEAKRTANVEIGSGLVLNDASMDALGPYWMELATAVFEFNKLDQADLGNSPSSPESPAA